MKASRVCEGNLRILNRPAEHGAELGQLLFLLGPDTLSLAQVIVDAVLDEADHAGWGLHRFSRDAPHHMCRPMMG